MNRTVLRRALLATLAGGGALAAGTANAKSRTEDETRYRRRTDDTMVTDPRFERLTRDLQPYAQGASATATLDGKDNELDALTARPGFRRVQGMQTARLGDVREAIDTISRVNPKAAQQFRGELESMAPARDRDVKEADLSSVGGLLAGGAALIATRGRSRTARQALMRALKVGGASAGGAALGGAFANADRAVLSGDDSGDIGKAAAVAGAIGIAAAGGRQGIRRLLRNHVVRRARMAQAMPDVSRKPALDALGAAEEGARTARKKVPWFESDHRILADDIVHMERTIEAAGMPRVFTAVDDPRQVARELARRGDWNGMQSAMDTLEGRYRQALKQMKVDGRDAPSLRIDDPYVTDPRDRAAIEQQVNTLVTRRKKRSRSQRKRRRAEREARTSGDME